MTKIVHTADVHLSQDHPERWQALQTVLDLAQKKQADLVTISGDLFDDGFSAAKSRTKLRSVFSDNDFPIVIIPGNHDQNSFEQGLFFGDDAVILNQKQHKYSYQQTDIYGLPFEAMKSSDLFKKIHQLNQELEPKRTNILLFHGELLDQFFSQDDFGQEGKRRYMPLKLSYFEQTKFDYVLSGHFHRSFNVQSLPNTRLETGGWFVYPGSPVAITQKETGPRVASLIEIEKKPQAIALNTAYFHPLKFTFKPNQTHTTLDKIVEKIKQQPTPAQILLTAEGYIDPQSESLSSQQLAKELKSIAQEYDLAALDNKVTDIGQILNDDLYKLFKQELAQLSDQKQQESIEKIMIEAMMVYQNK